MDLDAIRGFAERLHEQTRRVLVGHEESLRLLLIALWTEGHVLLEGPPGTAKTLLANVFARGLGLEFKRIQFTPDLMPGDILGSNLFDFKTGEFRLTKGSVFTEVLLADEINRTPPKTQAALLEAMQERVVTIDGTRHALGAGFMVVATQNPIEHEGTYPLPEAQLDRFLFKIRVGYPSVEEEREMAARHGTQTSMPDLDSFDLVPLIDLAGIEAGRASVRAVGMEEPVLHYVVDLVRATREDPSVLLGASPRAVNMLSAASRARAALAGRDFVVPDDVKALAVPLLAHRMLASPAAEMDGTGTEAIVERILSEVAAPR
ncbi:MAG: AAA family ATPase [Planctomycetota bacterium JB042]